MHIQGIPVSFAEIVTSDGTQLTLLDANGNERTIKKNERLHVDSIGLSATASTVVSVYGGLTSTLVKPVYLTRADYQTSITFNVAVALPIGHSLFVTPAGSTCVSGSGYIIPE